MVKRRRRRRRRDRRHRDLDLWEAASPPPGVSPGQAYDLMHLSMVMQLGFDEEAAERFMAWHDELPADIEHWSQEQLEAEVSRARASGDDEDWMRAMTLLSHHRTSYAAERLYDLLDLVPFGLRKFWDLAFAESVAWLSYRAAEAEERLAYQHEAEGTWTGTRLPN